MINLNQLQHLLALDETRHFAKAADKVHLSQPAFSRSIQALERQADATLFERKGRSVKPTPAGEYLINGARALVMQAKRLERDLEHYQRGEIGSLAFGVGPFPAATVTGPVILAIRQQYPNASVRVETVNPQALLALLVKEDIEFYVADSRAIPQAPYLKVQQLMQQRAYLYARPGHPLTQAPQRFIDAWHYGLATVKLPADLKVLLGLLAQAVNPEQEDAAFECDNVTLLCELALQSDTVVALTELAYERAELGAKLVRLDITDFPDLRSNIAIVRLKDRTLSPLAKFAIQQFEQGRLTNTN